MKKIVTMNKSICGAAGWIDAGKVDFIRASRWLKVKTNYTPGRNNSLWPYVSDENGYKPYQENFNAAGELIIDYFTFNGRNYAIDQFIALNNPFWAPFGYSYENADGKKCYLSGYDADGDIFHPAFIEFDECCENVRVYFEA